MQERLGVICLQVGHEIRIHVFFIGQIVFLQVGLKAGSQLIAEFRYLVFVEFQIHSFKKGIGVDGRHGRGINLNTA